MARMPIPLVVDGYCFLSGTVEEQCSFCVDSPAWYLWLADMQNRSFSVRCQVGCFTARHEQQRRGWYWYAYRKQAGKADKIYLGKPEDITQERIYKVALQLANKGQERVAPFSKGVTEQARAPKFCVPTIETAIVSRPHLLSQLDAGQKNKLIFLSAQAGWGKTALLSSWCKQLRDQDRPFAWITLDRTDNDPRGFWRSIITGLQMIQPEIGRKALEFVESRSPIDGIQYAVLDECLFLSRDSILLLDDVHLLTSVESQSALTFLLERLPDHLHLVLASRMQPPFPLARLRVQGKLLEIRSEELALRLPELVTLVDTIVNGSLSLPDYRLLAQRTEGWAAGVHLAALMMKTVSEPAQGLDYFSGSTPAVFDYLLEEVFLQQPIAVQNFLLHTSLLAQLSISQCDAICGNTNSREMLAYLRQNNIFIFPLDAQEHQYRYHPLFQEALQARLHQQSPLLEADIQQRIACWQEDQPKAQAIQENQGTEVLSAEQSKSLLMPAPAFSMSLLTDREREVLGLLLHGASNREIAQQLIISEGTTKKHIANICSKFNVQRRTQVITRVLEHASS